MNKKGTPLSLSLTKKPPRLQPVCVWVVLTRSALPPWFSLRCFFIAQSYVLVKKWSEALVLYERVLKYAKEVQSKAKSLNNSLKVGHCAN